MREARDKIPTRSQNGVSVRKADDLPHLLEDDMFHQDEDRRDLVREPEARGHMSQVRR